MTKKNKTKNKPGRPSILTPELREEFVGYIKSGCYIETACVIAGITRSTYYDWMKRGKESTRPNKYTKFYQEVKQALAWNEARLVAIIQIAAETDWRAAAWFLERRFPERWA